MSVLALQFTADLTDIGTDFGIHVVWSDTPSESMPTVALLGDDGRKDLVLDYVVNQKGALGKEFLGTSLERFGDGDMVVIGIDGITVNCTARGNRIAAGASFNLSA